MKRSFTLRVALAAAALGAAALAASPASATVGAATLTGTETYSPGLSSSPAFQTFSLSASGAIATDTVQGTINCSWSGSSSIAETYAAGQGSLSGSCLTSAGTSSVSGTYTRTGVVVTIDGTWVGAGVAGVFNAFCQQTPTSVSVPPVPPAVKPFAIWCVVWW